MEEVECVVAAMAAATEDMCRNNQKHKDVSKPIGHSVLKRLF